MNETIHPLEIEQGSRWAGVAGHAARQVTVRRVHLEGTVEFMKPNGQVSALDYLTFQELYQPAEAVAA